MEHAGMHACMYYTPGRRDMCASALAMLFQHGQILSSKHLAILNSWFLLLGVCSI